MATTTQIVVPSARRTPQSVVPPPSETCTGPPVDGTLAAIRQAFLNIGPSGGTVCIKAGPWTWNTSTDGPLLMTRPNVHLRGAGKDLTTITDLGLKTLIDVTTTPGSPIRISHMTLVGGTLDAIGTAQRGADGKFVMVARGTGQIRVDHMRFDCRPFVTGTGVLQVLAFSTRDGVTGVFDQNECLGGGGLRGAVNTDHESWLGVGDYGDNSWHIPVVWGTHSDFMFYEDNLWSLNTATSTAGWAHDSFSGGRMVFRRNRLVNVNIAAHGTEAGNRGRGTRAQEIYQNVAPDRTVGSSVFANVRSGTALFWKNKIGTDYTGLARLDNNRSYHNWGTFMASDGTCLYDKNDPVIYDTGVMKLDMAFVSGSNYELTVMNPNGTAKAWVTDHWSDGAYSIHNLSRGANTERGDNSDGGFILSNTATVITIHHLLQPTPSQQYPLPVFFAGDQIQIRKCLLSMDACGRGAGKLLIGDGQPTGFPSPAVWNEQDTDDPCYAWGNTLAETPSASNSFTTPVPHIVENRDYFNDGRVKSYTPASYPHPLRLSGPTWTPADEASYIPAPDYIP